MTEMSTNLKAMIKRKDLLRKGTPQAEAMADKILYAVEKAGGLTWEEVLTLQIH
jgi:hypothetical protein